MFQIKASDLGHSQAGGVFIETITLLLNATEIKQLSTGRIFVAICRVSHLANAKCKLNCIIAEVCPSEGNTLYLPTPVAPVEIWPRELANFNIKVFNIPFVLR